MPRRSDPVRRKGGRADGFERLDVLPQGALQQRQVAALRRGLVGAAVEIGEPPGDRVELPRSKVVSLDQPGQRPLFRHPPHPHRVLDGGRVSHRSERVAPVPEQDRVHPQVVARGKAPVEPHLLAAHPEASLGRPVVEEREDHRLLDLVGELAGQKDPGPVGLAQLDTLRPVWVEGRIEHRGNEVGVLSSTVEWIRHVGLGLGRRVGPLALPQHGFSDRLHRRRHSGR